MNHPTHSEWMAFLYGELPPAKRREFGAHLAGCAACAAEVQTWRAGMDALPQWDLPAIRSTPRLQWWPTLKWAVAAALVLGFCFLLGRQTSPAAAELTALKATVAKLEQSVRREADFDPADAVQSATTAANAETLRLLAEFSLLQDDQRAADQRALNLTLQAFNLRLQKLRGELETVALNTETGFQQTHENLTHLVSLSLPEPK